MGQHSYACEHRVYNSRVEFLQGHGHDQKYEKVYKDHKDWYFIRLEVFGM